MTLLDIFRNLRTQKTEKKKPFFFWRYAKVARTIGANIKRKKLGSGPMPITNRRPEMIRHADLSISKNTQGAWVVSAIVGGYLMTRQFYYYTKKEAARLFLLEANA